MDTIRNITPIGVDKLNPTTYTLLDKILKKIADDNEY